MCVFAAKYGGKLPFKGGCFSCQCERVMNIKQTRRNSRYINKGGLFFFMIPFEVCSYAVCGFDISFPTERPKCTSGYSTSIPDRG